MKCCCRRGQARSGSARPEGDVQEFWNQPATMDQGAAAVEHPSKQSIASGILRVAQPSRCVFHKLHRFNVNELLQFSGAIAIRECMKSNQSKVLNALSQPNRLALFEAIAGAPEGLTTTEAANAAGTLLNTAAVNLTVLEAAGLISSKKKGRSVTHTAKLATVHRLADYLNQIGR